MRADLAERLISRSVNMEAIVTHHLIVKWRKKTVKKPQPPEMEEKHLNKKVLSDGALQQFFVW
ncbi:MULTISPECIES: hypothetical protein [unclassified Caballeronia]|uniref:hypothetical protein n=1 Tax=unclassified Caballeronia TaxID=2646786 RepID=UPI00031BB9ED|nr:MULTISPECIES: hypothetical protein [unclassified Caballeronia]MCE4542244.1 hypothetical protein [Caballeronia sp. PC1]MCE4568709.1 hypothetical protein [Caballeronia sp. CLC5]